MPQHKAKILIIGPMNSGKSTLANFLCDLNITLPKDIRSTKGLRILEYDIPEIEIGGHKSEVDVQLWDASGDDNIQECFLNGVIKLPYKFAQVSQGNPLIFNNSRYSSFWPVFRKNVDGVVFVYSQEDDFGVRKLDLMYNYFVTQPNLSPRACLVCAMQADEVNAKLSSTFSKVSQIIVNLDAHGEKFKQDFAKYVVSVVNTTINK